MPGNRQGLDTMSLMDQLLLLAIDRERGTIDTPVPAGILLAAAALVELSLHGGVRIVDGMVEAISDEPTGDPLLDTVGAGPPREGPQRPHVWILRAHRRRALEEQVLARLETRGLIQRQERRALWVFRRCRYFASDGVPQRQLRDTLIRALRIPRARRPERPACLAALLHASGMLPAVLGNEPDATDLVREASSMAEDDPRAPAFDALAEVTRGVRLAVEATLMSTLAGGTGTTGVGWTAQDRLW